MLKKQDCFWYNKVKNEHVNICDKNKSGIIYTSKTSLSLSCMHARTHPRTHTHTMSPSFAQANRIISSLDFRVYAPWGPKQLRELQQT